MKALILNIAFVVAMLAPQSALASNGIDLDNDQYTPESYVSERDRMVAYLEQAKSIKHETLSELTEQYAGHEEDMVGVDEVMDSFEVNELVAEIMEAENIY